MFASRASWLAHELDAKDYPVISPSALFRAQDTEGRLCWWRHRQVSGGAYQTCPCPSESRERERRPKTWPRCLDLRIRSRKELPLQKKHSIFTSKHLQISLLKTGRSQSQHRHTFSCAKIELKFISFIII